MSIPERAEAVAGLLGALDLPPATLVGHSSGAMLAAHLANHHPYLVRRCALVSPPGPMPHYPVGLYRAIAQVFRLRAGRAVMRPVLRGLFKAAGFPAYVTDDERLHTTVDAAAQDFDPPRVRQSSR